MVSRRHASVRLIQPAIFLQRLEPADRAQLAGVLNSSLVHGLVLFRSADSGRLVYSEVGPGCLDKTLDDAVARCPSGYSVSAVIPARYCPEECRTFDCPPGNLTKDEPGRPVSLRDLSVELAGSAKSDVVDPADTLRRALHNALSAITDREVSLSVREGGSVDQQRHFAERERELDELARRLDVRESELKLLRRALDHRERELLGREKSMAELDTELKTRKNSVHFREKSLAAREAELDARIFDLNAREGELVTAEKSMAVREKMAAASERRHAEATVAFAAERSRMDAELKAVRAELAAREDLVAAREKVLESREATIKAETIAMLQALETITNASRVSSTIR